MSIIFSWDLQWARRGEKEEEEEVLSEEKAEVLLARGKVLMVELLGMGMFFEVLNRGMENLPFG